MSIKSRLDRDSLLVILWAILCGGSLYLLTFSSNYWWRLLGWFGVSFILWGGTLPFAGMLFSSRGASATYKHD